MLYLILTLLLIYLGFDLYLHFKFVRPFKKQLDKIVKSFEEEK